MMGCKCGIYNINFAFIECYKKKGSRNYKKFLNCKIFNQPKPVQISHSVVSYTDYGRPVKKLPSLHGRKSNPNPKIFGMAEAYFVCHSGPNLQISLIYAFIGCP
jgi:hypothetical protein